MLVSARPHRADGFAPSRVAEKPGLPQHARILTVMLLLFNHMAAVDATPIGTPEMVQSTQYWILLALLFAVLALIMRLRSSDSPIKVVGLTYDRESHSLELKVENKGSQPYEMKSALRLVQPSEQTEELIRQAADERGIPMAQARASVGSRRLFQLLCEDDSPIMIAPNETKTVTYKVAAPKDMVELDSSKSVEVQISYGEPDHIPFVDGAPDQPMQDQSMSIKLTEGDLDNPQYLLEDLLEAVKNSPPESVAEHFKGANEISQWVRSIAGIEELAQSIDSIADDGDPKNLKDSLISEISSHIESMKHPYLRRVQEKFVMKETDLDIIAHIAMLDELADVMESASNQAMEFHLRKGNDFASWIQNAVGDQDLAQKINSIDYSDPSDARQKAVSAIRERTDSLR